MSGYQCRTDSAVLLSTSADITTSEDVIVSAPVRLAADPTSLKLGCLPQPYMPLRAFMISVELAGRLNVTPS